MPVRKLKNKKIVDCFRWNEGSQYDKPHSLIPPGGLIRWSRNPFTWDDVCLALEVGSGTTATGDWLEGYEQLDDDKKQKFITLLCKVKERKKKKHSQPIIYKERKPIKDNIKVTAQDVKLVVNEVLVGVQVDVTEK